MAVLLGIAFLASNWLWIIFSYIAWSRAAMAWGKDGMGPKWFTAISPRTGQPVKLLLTLLVVSEVALLYFSVFSEVLHSLSVGVMQLFSVFTLTAVAAIVFPFLKRVRPIWNLSPYRDWTLGRIPVITIAGILSLLLTGILIYGFFVNDEFEELHLWWVIINFVVWISGALWYLLWKRFHSNRGRDVRQSFTRMPPE